MAGSKNRKGVSLAKGPVGIIGLVLLIYGITALIFGGHGFTLHAPSGTVNGKSWLGLEVNGWSSLLFVAAGLLLLLGAPLHWGAKSLAMIVGLALGAACVIALIDGKDVFGIFAANGLTKLVWGVAAVLLILLALLPRVGGNKKTDEGGGERRREPRRVERQPRTVERDVVDDTPRRGRRQDGSVVAPASGATPESQQTTRRQRKHGEF